MVSFRLDALERLYDRLVLSQSPARRNERRTDEQVWAAYQDSLAKEKVSRVLQPKTFLAEGFELKFDHAFKNERWHVLQPVSMDYAKAEYMRNKVTRTLGNAIALQGNPEMGTLYILLGAPQAESHQDAYDKAKRLLHRMPIRHELIEEGRADQFAKELAHYMQEHGITNVETDDR